MIVLDYRDQGSLCEQVVERFQELMFNRVLLQDSQLSSVCSLAAKLSINPNTIQRAYGELKWQEYIYSIRSKGSFVADGSRLRADMLGEWKIRFESSVNEDIKIGVTEEDMTGIIEEKYREYMIERGERHD